ncbi:alpha-tubulin N-acetyltransferase-like [Patiria miniata]|uniref:Alpha-tubulin N-acetyltransferase n=1 Tax=Patiria miniata TaxID=46514 RepID=A0A914AJR9_PATMI|nr:alpha-tubulin N-acetyltransferase-like [Patiria miniata]
MEFKFNINHLFGETVTVVDSRLEPCRSTGENLRLNMEKVINEMGQASAKAQGLHGPITSAHKLGYSNHHLYVMKDASANGGLGAAVGILKVGRKKLFVLDAHGNQIEMEPLCVLDFYVHESCQRRGCGKRLFQAMLGNEGIQAQHLPIDRPSHKFTSFLTKHYNLRATIHQVNNFVIFDGFFRGQPEESFVRKRSGIAGNRKPPLAPNKREIPHSGYRNASNAALWSHHHHTTTNASTRRNSLDNPTTAQAELTKDALPSIGRSGSAGSISSQRSGGSPHTPGTSETKDPLLTGNGAQANNYSRHKLLTGTPPSPSGTALRPRNSPVAANVSLVPNGSPVHGGRVPIRDATPPFGRPDAIGLNSHLTTQTRDGHLKLSPIATSTVPGGTLKQSPVLPGIGAATSQQAVTGSPSNPNGYGYNSSSAPSSGLTSEGNYCVTPPTKTMHSSWNVMGIPPSYQQQHGMAHRTPRGGGSNRPW